MVQSWKKKKKIKSPAVLQHAVLSLTGAKYDFFLLLLPKPWISFIVPVQAMINSTALWIFIPTACNAQPTLSMLLNSLGKIHSIRCTYAGFWCFCYLYLIKNILSAFKTVPILFQGWGFFLLWLIESRIAQYRFSFVVLHAISFREGFLRKQIFKMKKKKKRSERERKRKIMHNVFTDTSSFGISVFICISEVNCYKKHYRNIHFTRDQIL